VNVAMISTIALAASINGEAAIAAIGSRCMMSSLALKLLELAELA
jgi:hypothetical protein